MARFSELLRAPRVRLGVALLAGLVVGTGVVLPRIVRGQIDERAARRGITIESASLHLDFFAVRLTDLTLRLDGVQSLSIGIDQVTVPLTLSLHPREIRAEGFRVRYPGAISEFAHEISAFRDRHPPKDASAASVQALPVTIENAELRIEHPSSALVVLGARLSRESGGWAASATQVSNETNALRAELENAKARFTEGRLDEASLQKMTLSFRAAPKPDGAIETKSPPPTDEDPKPLALPTIPDVAILRDLLDNALAQSVDRFGKDMHASIDTLALRSSDGRSLGEGRLDVKRTASGAGFVADFVTTSSGVVAPLTFQARLEPKGEARVQLRGGPVSLKLLGVAEGAAGLIDTDRAEVSVQGALTLSQAGDTLSFDGDVGVKRLGIALPKVAKDPVHDIEFRARANAMISRLGELKIESAEISMGALRLLAKGAAKRSADELAADLSFELVKSPCDVLLHSIPEMLVPDLAGVRLSGNFGIRGRTSFRSSKFDDLVLDVHTDDTCHFVELPELLKKDRFSAPFLHRVYTPEHEFAEEEMGPGTENWTPLEEITPFMQAAVLTTEDGAFPHHRGFSSGAIRNSLIANLKAGKFVRGASTISMQLAKNLFLFRDKTLSRKLEEFILTDYLESSFTKDEMMELYLNVIEFGPNVYGITNAAEHYFGKLPKDLTLLECMFLSSMLPKPVKDHWVVEKGLPDHWLKTLQSYVRTAAKTGKISEREMAQALLDKVVFRPGEKTTRVKRPVKLRRPADDESSDWKPVQ